MKALGILLAALLLLVAVGGVSAYYWIMRKLERGIDNLNR